MIDICAVGWNNKFRTVLNSPSQISFRGRAVDRLVNSAYELVLEGESYRPRQKPKGARP